MSSNDALTPNDVLKGRSPASPALQKGVVLDEEPDEIIPPPVYNDDDERPDSPIKYHKASISGKKMVGRPQLPQMNSSATLVRQLSGVNLSGSEQWDSSAEGSQNDANKILNQVAEWLQQEQSKRSKKTKKSRRPIDKEIAPDEDDDDEDDVVQPAPEPTGDGSDIDLSSLESILAGYMKGSSGGSSTMPPRSGSVVPRKSSIARKFKRASVAPQSSDTEFFGDEILVPNVEATLDNTKTLSYSGGGAETDTDSNDKASKKDQKNWNKFKQEILTLTHTLRLKGWRRIPIEKGSELEVARLSGALTNAVYVVKPPKNLEDDKVDGSAIKKKKPMHLLLRVYGPQVEHLIDRNAELAILRRLAKKKIGPRMLGTFSNGRFEEFLHARTLEAEDLRVPETSKQIAKRMRELHEGIELLDTEIDKGPATFVNWDSWVDRCEKVITWLDKQVHQAESGTQPKPKAKYTRLGLICGVEWSVFRRTYETYRAKLAKEYGGEAGIKRKLVFAHSDTQYGNLMRLEPAGESPLLHASNTHKQLVVIDFEYAGQNTAGLEFANHFTEWCYNYHHAEKPYQCNTTAYPTPEEQHRFVRSYVMHRPQFNPSASATPKMDGKEKTSISDFMLDARAPPGGSGGDYDAEEVARDKKLEENIQRLLHETRLWRIANSAQWVAWGIVQAQIPELDKPEPQKVSVQSVATGLKDKVKGAMHAPHIHARSDPLDEEEQALKEDAQKDRPEGRVQEEAHAEGSDDEDAEFDYLAYAQERAMLFWGDCLQMGLIKEQAIPETMKKMLKTVPY